jgi:hypothetical protein
MSADDTEYYRFRAATERTLASSSARANVAEIHAELAGLYDALASQAELRPKLGISVRVPEVNPAPAEARVPRI